MHIVKGRSYTCCRWRLDTRVAALYASVAEHRCLLVGRDRPVDQCSPVAAALLADAEVGSARKHVEDAVEARWRHAAAQELRHATAQRVERHDARA